MVKTTPCPYAAADKQSPKGKPTTP
ncbi:hypothetical protein CCACVL1_25452 [Corchorus capsularis]|uniref:Uncharacterized protein n=1 Tax=Corchorus capsularis TaxID=210143 RepID=A0A1R3GKD1_COCAP|nr:hypothetical protein CCACVL1_25452 [Corchorus capsularis]